MHCLVEEKLGGPQCPRELDADGNCAVHCRALVRNCRRCKRHFEPGEGQTCTKCQYQRNCPKRHVKGRRRCRSHGGETPRGRALPQTKTGRYSKDLPARLQADYEAALTDPALLELRDSIALTRARIHDVLKRVDAGETGAIWRRLRKLATKFRAASRADDRTQMQAVLGQMLKTIEEGAADWARWGEIVVHQKNEKLLVESERKRHVEMQQMITSERAMILLAAVVNVITRHVTDPGTLRAISADIRVLMVDRAGEPG